MKTEIRPTPETDALHAKQGLTHASYRDFASKLERERDEALALATNYSERWTAECKTLRGQIEAMREAIKKAYEALAKMLHRDERNTCRHEETHRAGYLWEICETCGMRWADDEGGRPEFTPPNEWQIAESAIAKLKPLLND